MLLKLYFKTNELVNCNNISSYDIIYLCMYVTLPLASKINNASVLKYYSDVMMRCPERD